MQKRLVEWFKWKRLMRVKHLVKPPVLKKKKNPKTCVYHRWLKMD
jgi:hypothetical protein